MIAVGEYNAPELFSELRHLRCFEHGEDVALIEVHAAPDGTLRRRFLDPPCCDAAHRAVNDVFAEYCARAGRSH